MKPAAKAGGKPQAAAAKGGGAKNAKAAAEAEAKAKVEADAAAAAEAKAKAEAEAAAAAEAEAKAKAKAEAEAALKAEQEAAEAEARRKKEMGNGKIVVKYEMYDEEFDIVDGSTTAAAIDDLYCLSDVMPKCKIFLSPCSPQEKMEYLDKEIDAFFYVEENPKQTYQNLEKGTVYYAYIQENEDEFKRYQKRTKKIFKAEEKEEQQQSEYAKEGIPETCSCIYGNPCVDEYGCKNWAYRFAIAKKNGWKEAF